MVFETGCKRGFFKFVCQFLMLRAAPVFGIFQICLKAVWLDKPKKHPMKKFLIILALGLTAVFADAATITFVWDGILEKGLAEQKGTDAFTKGSKPMKRVLPKAEAGTEVPVPFFLRNCQKMTDEELTQLGTVCLQIEKEYAYKSADIEWAFEGDKLYILQSRAFVALQ